MTVPQEHIGWFSDIDREMTKPDGAPMYQPCVQTSFYCGGLGIWFDTEGESDAFIREEILGKGFAPSEGKS